MIKTQTTCYVMYKRSNYFLAEDCSEYHVFQAFKTLNQTLTGGDGK